MDRLSKEQQDKIKKTSSFRLQQSLCRVGISEDSVEGMDRQTLIETWATYVADGRDKPVEEGAFNPQIKEHRLAFERKKMVGRV